MYILGLTGGIGSGKTMVSDYLGLRGASIIDVDTISHELTQEKTNLTHKIQEKFKQQFNLDVKTKAGFLNRALLRNFVFENKKALIELEKLIHPEIQKCVLEKLKNISGPYTVLVIPLLIEKKFLIDKIDRILLVDCSEETQIKRVIKRNQLTPSNIKKIISSQANRENRLKIADDVIINENKSKKMLINEVMKYHKIYLNFAKSKRTKIEG